MASRRAWAEAAGILGAIIALIGLGFTIHDHLHRSGSAPDNIAADHEIRHRRPKRILIRI
jgi:hypothetical protein